MHSFSQGAVLTAAAASNLQQRLQERVSCQLVDTQPAAGTQGAELGYACMQQLQKSSLKLQMRTYGTSCITLHLWHQICWLSLSLLLLLLLLLLKIKTAAPIIATIVATICAPWLRSRLTAVVKGLFRRIRTGKHQGGQSNACTSKLTQVSCECIELSTVAQGLWCRACIDEHQSGPNRPWACLPL